MSACRADGDGDLDMVALVCSDADAPGTVHIAVVGPTPMLLADQSVTLSAHSFLVCRVWQACMSASALHLIPNIQRARCTGASSSCDDWCSGNADFVLDVAVRSSVCHPQGP